MEPRHSILGIISFVIALCVTGLIVAAFAVVAVLQHGHPPGDYPGQEIVGLVVILCFFADLLAVVLGAVALFEKARKRIFGVLGLCISGVMLLGIAGILALGVVVMLVRH